MVDVAGELRIADSSFLEGGKVKCGRSAILFLDEALLDGVRKSQVTLCEYSAGSRKSTVRDAGDSCTGNQKQPKCETVTERQKC
jgi:hypothetical protein